MCGATTVPAEQQGSPNSVLKFDSLVLCLARCLVPYDPSFKPFIRAARPNFAIGDRGRVKFLAKAVADAGKPEEFDGLSLNLSFALGFKRSTCLSSGTNLGLTGHLGSRRDRDQPTHGGGSS